MSKYTFSVNGVEIDISTEYYRLTLAPLLRAYWKELEYNATRHLLGYKRTVILFVSTLCSGTIGFIHNRYLEGYDTSAFLLFAFVLLCCTVVSVLADVSARKVQSICKNRLFNCIRECHSVMFGDIYELYCTFANRCMSIEHFKEENKCTNIWMRKNIDEFEYPEDDYINRQITTCLNEILATIEK